MLPSVEVSSAYLVVDPPLASLVVASSSVVVVDACTCAVAVAVAWPAVAEGSSAASVASAAGVPLIVAVLEQGVTKHEHLDVGPYRAACRPSLDLPGSLAERADLTHRA